MKRLKSALWFLFRSPQRKMVGWKSLQTDFYGFFEIRRHQRNKKELRPITVCTGLYNRSENYLNIVLDALNNAEHKDLICLSVFDCASDDISNLEEKIKGKFRLIRNRLD